MADQSAPAAPRPLQDGLLIVFEGIDGAGKTTQLQRAQQVLHAEGWPLYVTRNLGGTPIGEALRDVMKSPLPRPGATNLYLSVAIQEALIGAVTERRQEGKLILMDRGPLSLAAYEVYGGGLDSELGWRHVADGMARLRPELTIIYQTDTDTAQRRAKQKRAAADYFEAQSPAYFKRVAKGYLTAAERYPEQTAIVDANQPIAAVHAETMRLIRRAIAAKS